VKIIGVNLAPDFHAYKLHCIYFIVEESSVQNQFMIELSEALGTFINAGIYELS